MLDKVLKAVENYNMLEQGDSVLVGLSGGADSMALLHAMMQLSGRFGLRVSAAHINHGLRGEEAQRDEKFAAEFCRRNGIELHILHADIRAEAKKSGEGEEECGRRVRYDFFASKAGDGKIATAHTASDNAETVLFNLARGTSLKGMCGIPPVRGNIIRPLIYCTRADIESYCEKNNVSYVTDSTNLNDEYSRNKIRLSAVPALREVNPAFDSSISRFCSSASMDEDFLHSQTLALLEKSKLPGGCSAPVLLAAHPALRRRALMELIREFVPEKVQGKTLESAEEVLKNGGTAQIQNDIFFTNRKGVVFAERRGLPAQEWTFSVDVGGCELLYNEKRIIISRVNKKVFFHTQKIHKQILDYCVDCDKIIGNVQIGSRRAGDRISLPRRGVTKTLKKLFNEAAVDPSQRNALAVLRDDAGVIWAERFGADSRCAVGADTQNFLIIDIGGLFDE